MLTASTFRLSLVLCLSASLLTGCGGAQEAVQTTLDRTVLGSVVGRPYASAVQSAMPALPLGPPPVAPYGDLFASTTLPDGSTVRRHISRNVGQTSRVSILGLAGSETQRFAYRLIYFRVDRAGVIVDTANGFWLGESQRCVGYLGSIFQSCDNPQALAADVAFFDGLVKTSDGRGLEAWGVRR